MHAVNRRWYWFARQFSPCCSVYSVALLLMVLCMFLLVVNIYELRLMQVDHAALHNVPLAMPNVDFRTDSSPVVWVQGQQLEVGYMRHVFNVFERIGYRTGNSASDWDVLWSHDYPFKTMSADLGHLKPHQKVNHFPGSGCLTNKVQLVTSELSFIPKAFLMPSQKQDFLDYVKENPGKQWVQKNNNHRGIKILSVQELDLDTPNSFVQEFVEDSFLIDKRRFDIGLYVTLTSVNPLRVFIYQGDWLIRFCSMDYYPFDPSAVEKYVVSDDYTPLWEITSLAKFYTELGSSRKSALFSYLRSIGKDPDILSQNLEAAVRNVFYSKERNILRQSTHYTYRNFFEMVRFDFLIDQDLNVFLMEVNMSPNLSSEHFIGNKLLYEQVVFSLLGLVGIASPVAANKKFTQDTDDMEMLVSNRDLHVLTNNCTSDGCNQCQLPVCRLCSNCMNKELESVLMAGYLEQMNRHTWRRAIPKPFQTQDIARTWYSDTDEEFQRFSTSNKVMSLWFHGKCLEDAAWCV